MKEKKRSNKEINVADTPREVVHNRGSAPALPVNRKHVASRGVQAMHEQIDHQMKQIMDQIALLSQQVEGLKRKKNLSYIIYNAKLNFKPVVGESYFLYRDEEVAKFLLSILSPEEWGNKFEGKTYMAHVYLSGDYSWEILESSEYFSQIKLVD